MSDNISTGMLGVKSAVVGFVSQVYKLFSSGILCVVVFCILTVEAYPADVVVVQSSALQPYQQAVDGFLDDFQREQQTSRSKRAVEFQIERILIQPGLSDDGWRKKIRKQRPEIVVAVGSHALRIASGVEDVPVVYAMVPRPEDIVGNSKRYSGISMIVPPLNSLKKLHKFYPHVQKIAILYNPEYSRAYLQQAREAALLLGYQLVELQVNSPQEVPQLLFNFKEPVETLWMIADPHVVTSTTAESFVDYSIRNRVLLMTFAKKYLKMGATFAVVSDSGEMGRNASQLALNILRQHHGPEPQVHAPVAFHVFENNEILRKLALLKKATK